MRRFISILSILLTFNFIQAQSIKLFHNLSGAEKRGDKFFEKSQYDHALIFYKKASEKDTTRNELAIKIGESYRLINEFENAEYWYKKEIDTNSNDPEIWMKYAQILIINNKYDEAKIWLDLHDQKVGQDQRASKKLQTIENIHSYYTDSSFIKVNRLNINTEFAEFSPSYYQDGIVFLSDRHTSNFHNVMDWNEEDYVAIYYIEEREDGSMKEPQEFHSGLNSEFHEGPLAFYKNQIFLTRTGVRSKKSKESHLEIYSGEYDDEKKEWVDIRPLPFNDKSYSIGHPTISPDGQELIFSSNMNNGYGATDLYISQKNGNEWSTPKNLGAIINSKGNEMFPYFISKTQLIFASDGHGGLGDLDLFQVDLSNITHASIENLGYPYNSPYADFGYISNENQTKGFFTSNRLNNGKDDDIYQFDTKWIKIDGNITEIEDGSSLDQVEVRLTANGELRDVSFSDSLGHFHFLTFPKEKIIIKASKEGYISQNINLKLNQSDAGTAKQIQIRLDRKSIDTQIDEKDQRLAQLEKLYNKKKALVQVDGRVFEYKEIGNYQYLINADQQILLSKDPPDLNKTIEERATKAVESKGLTMTGSFFIKNIYFDLNSVTISTEGKKELDKVIKVMTMDPIVSFEIVSYTDSRGKMAFNDELAFKRSQEIARYLIANDVSGSRLILENYGEQGLLNDCDDFKECDEIFHAINRRAEFKLVMRKFYSEQSKE